MEILDLRKKYKPYYSATGTPALVKMQPARYLSISGKGDPAEILFAENVQALYATAFGIKFICKAALKDFIIAKLEALWWYDTKQLSRISMKHAPLKIPRRQWHYQLLLRMPDFIKEEYVLSTKEHIANKKKLETAKNVELFQLQEGTCVQILHRGSFSTEADSLAKLQTFMQTHNLQRNGLHHKIYLSDLRKTAPDKLRTILREPVK